MINGVLASLEDVEESTYKTVQSFLSTFLTCLSNDDALGVAWLLQVEKRSISLCLLKQALPKGGTVDQDRVTSFDIESFDVELTKLVKHTQQFNDFFHIVPGELIKELPLKLQSLLFETKTFKVLPSQCSSYTLLGVTPLNPIQIESSTRIMPVAAQLCLLYHDSMLNINALQRSFLTIEAIEIPVIQYDFSELYHYLDYFYSPDLMSLGSFFNEISTEFSTLFNRAVLIYTNQACFRFLKASDKSQIEALLASCLQDVMLEYINKLRLSDESGKDYYRTEVVIADTQGRELHAILKLKFPSQENGTSLTTISLFDITEQKAVENKIKEAFLRYELVVQGSAGAIWDWDILNQTVNFSPNWASLRGYTLAEIGNHQEQWLKSIHPEDVDGVLAQVSDHFSGKDPIFISEYRIVRKDSSIRWVADRGIAQRNDDGEVIRMAGSETDITEKRESEQKLRLGASVFENAAEAIMILNTDREIIDVNTAFCELQGCTVSQLIGKQAEIFLSDSGSKSDFAEIWQHLSQYHKWQGELGNRNNKGDVLPVWVTLSCVLDDSGSATHYVALMADISQIKRSEAMLYRLAHHDSLTGLPNRLLLNKRIEQSIQHSKNSKNILALIFIDLDNFKFINDGLSHAAGDQLLQQIASRLLRTVRARDTVARIGGDEFVIVLQDLKKLDDISKIAKKLLDVINEPTVLSNRTIHATASIGITVYPSNGEKPDELIGYADAAMYRAKSLGKHNFQFYTQALTKRAVERMLLESSLKDAVKQQQLVLHYQPQYDLLTRKLTGFEALVRWLHPQMGLLGPDKFIPIAEETGCIEDIGTWVIREACAQASRWLQQGFIFNTISVNVSCRQLLKEDLVTVVMQALTDYQLEANRLEVEITESAVMAEPDRAIEQLHQLRKLGVRLAIDDFGEGYSSLGQLKRMPIHLLKIDKSFIRDFSFDIDSIAIIEAIIAMAKSMNLSVIAEGVETLEQEAFLITRQCTAVQGYLYSKPKPAHAINAAIFSI